MNNGELQYLQLLKEIVDTGIEKEDRTGIGTISIFGTQVKFNLDNGFPLLTTKKTFLRGIFVELIWIIRGDTNIKFLVDNDVHIWDEWAFQNYLKLEGLETVIPKYTTIWFEEKDTFIKKIKDLPVTDDFIRYGSLGPVYGKQWRDFNGVDQLKQVVNDIISNPNSRRLIVSAWNPSDLGSMLLPPCHMFYQFSVNGDRLDLQLYQRSADLFLGVPFNIASYSLLLTLVAKITGYKAGVFTHTLGDVHIYKNHFKQVEEQLSREPYPFPKIEILKDIKTLEDIENLVWEDIKLIDYKSHPSIKAPVAV